MNTNQKKYTAFMESVCKEFNCPEMLPALNAGFKAFCESLDGQPDSCGSISPDGLAMYDEFMHVLDTNPELMSVSKDWKDYAARVKSRCEKCVTTHDYNKSHYDSATESFVPKETHWTPAYFDEVMADLLAKAKDGSLGWSTPNWGD